MVLSFLDPLVTPMQTSKKMVWGAVDDRTTEECPEMAAVMNTGGRLTSEDNRHRKT